MVVTREERTTLPPDMTAAKAVLTNIGPADKRWNFKEQLGHSGPVNVRCVRFDVTKMYNDDDREKDDSGIEDGGEDTNRG